LYRVRVRKSYQITIPKKIRSKFGIEEGTIIEATIQDGAIVLKPLQPLENMETPKHITNPSDTLWCLFGKPIDVDAVKLVEESWETSLPPAEHKKPRSRIANQKAQ
jgi:AbrB family looped-hinge helix DNA binding protein